MKVHNNDDVHCVRCTSACRWALAERGVLRASNIAHSRKDGSAAELLLHQKERKDQPASLFPEPEIAKNSQVWCNCKS
jgi:oligosaccharyltransferase complex subunit beta